jgi:Putative beta-barrel porin-2, OmpL-like. bbp2
MKQILEMKLFRRLASAGVVAAYALSPALSFAQQASPAASPAVVTAGDGKENKEAKKVVEQPKPPEPRFKLYGWIEGGITGNPDAPTDNHNFGHLFTDRSNEPLLNQLSIVGERALDPNATGFDWGFKAWFMYGSDARYTKSVGFLDLATDDRVQPDFPELYASAHIPIPSTNGLDLKVGKYADPESAETIDPRQNVFYSHSYIFNFGVPLNDLGALATLHVNKYLDVYAGINRGVNMAFSDNNSSLAFEGGFGLNLLDGNLTVVALTHDGPEDTLNNHDWRYLNDITTTWKITKALTSITDLNLIYDSLGNGHWGGGGAQYFTYSVNDWLQVGLRGEIFRDSSGFYVAQFRANNDFLHFERGDNVFRPSFPFDPSNLGGGDTTYFEVTGGVTFKPPLPKPIAGLLIRPEVRYDRALTSFTPFNQNTKQDQWTLGLDVILEF